jgi:ATP-dependent DNA ligase
LRASAGEVLEAKRKLGLEGVVGKRIDSIYEPDEGSGINAAGLVAFVEWPGS